MSKLITKIRNRLKENKIKKTIILPEAEDERVLKAALRVLEDGIVNIILVGNNEKILEDLNNDNINEKSLDINRYIKDESLKIYDVEKEETLYNYVLSKNSITRTKDNKKAIKKAEDTLYFYKQSILAIEELKKNQNNDGRITKQVYKKFKQLYTNGLIEKLKEMFKIIQTEKNEELRIEIEKFFENVKKEKIYKNIIGMEWKNIIKRKLLKYNMMLYLKKAIEKDDEDIADFKKEYSEKYL